MGERKREGMSRFVQAVRRCSAWGMAAAFVAAWSCGLGTGCRRAPSQKPTTVNVCLHGGAQRGLTLYELRANTGTVTVAAIRLDKQGCGRFRFGNDSLSLFALQTDALGDTAGASAPLVLFPTVGGTLAVEADYADLVGSAHVNDAAGEADSLHILPFQRAQQACERLNREAADYWRGVRYEADANRIYDSLVESLDRRYHAHKAESLRLAARYQNTLVPVYLAQLPFGNRPLFDPQDPADLRLLSEWAAAMRQNLPGNPHVTRFADNIERLEQLQRLQAVQRERNHEKDTSRSHRP
ncbi:MAG: hypothetical protein K2G46_02135 [Bacteroidales bacterium]|nr:hypothetical protein [Bacteroidales bacterium]